MTGSVGRAGAVQVCAPREAACEFLRLSSSQPAWDQPTGLVGSSRAADRVVNVAFFMLRSRRSRSHVRTYVSVDASCAACHMHHSLGTSLLASQVRIPSARQAPSSSRCPSIWLSVLHSVDVIGLSWRQREQRRSAAEEWLGLGRAEFR